MDFYRDVNLSGFGLKVTNKGTKSFFVEGRIKNADKTRRKVLGRYDGTKKSLETARAKALNTLANFAAGQDRVANPDDANPILDRVLNDYISDKRLKPSTEADYRKVVNWGLKDWLIYPLININRDMVIERHTALGKRSHAQANYAMRILRAMFNYAIERYRGPRGLPLVIDNPVLVLSKIKSWFRVPRRRTVIARRDLPAWWKAVQGLAGERSNSSAEVVKDYLQTLLFTGMRPTEAARLSAQDLNLQDRIFISTETKNWEEHALPMSEPVWEIFARRMDASDTHLFPTPDAKTHISDIRYWIREVREASAVSFIPYDLRRTFITIAESLDLSGYTLKRLLNHKIMDSDVTAGYIVTDVER
ncbi:MAG: integrase family protein, partial [Gammaproteobacteria bacterium]|nr:integrase family protein [Gammaproteobacteria bacterium]